MENQRKFKFTFVTIDNDHTFTDQNIHAWKFINIGEVNAIINGGFILQAPQTTNANYIFEENLVSNEKTAQGYKIVFKSQPNKKQGVQVVMKIEVVGKG